jgi:transcriptional regulator of aromatic amino acid metabolism
MSNSAIAKALSISDSTMSRITNSEDYQQYKQRLYEDNHRLYKKNHSTTTTTSTKDIQPTETVDEQYTLILKGVNLILEYQKDMIKELQEAKQQKRRIF